MTVPCLIDAASRMISFQCSRILRGFDLRKCRYIGLEKTRLQHALTAAAMNLERVYAWLEGIPLAPTRSSQFEKMAAQKLAT